MKNSFSEEQAKVILSIGEEHFTEIYKKRYNKLFLLEKSAKYDEYNTNINSLVNQITTLVSMTDHLENDIKTCENIVKDLIIKFMYVMSCLLHDTDYEYNHFNELTNLFFAELESSMETHKTRQYDIRTYLDIKKTKGNKKRKEKFDSKNEEDKLSHRLYRRFGLGNLLDTIKGVSSEPDIESPEVVEPEEGYDNIDQNIDNFE